MKSSSYWINNDDAKYQLLNTDELIPGLNSMESLAEIIDSINHYTEDIISSDYDWPEDLPKGLKAWIKLKRGDITSTSFPSIPTRDSLGEIFGEAPHADTSSVPEIFLSVFDYSGYNFSVEHSRIYERTMEPPASRTVHLAIIQRALEAYSSKIDKELKTKLSELILTLLGWFHDLTDFTMREYLSSTYSKLKLPTSSKFLRASTGVNWQVYIGELPMNKENKLKKMKENDNNIIENNNDQNINDILSNLSVTFRLEEDILYIINNKNTNKYSNKNNANNNEENEKIFTMFYYHTINFNHLYYQFLSNFISNQLNLNKNLLKFNINLNKNEVDYLFNNKNFINSSFFITLSSINLLYNKYNRKNKLNNIKKLKFVTNFSTLENKISSNSYSNYYNDIYSWGYDSFYSMGLSLPSVEVNEDNANNNQNPNNLLDINNNNNDEKYQEEIHFPRSVPQSKLLTLERVKMIACSARHSLLLTHFGSIFSCGDNSEGALGLGDIFPRNSFTLIEWSNPLYISSNNSNSPINESNKVTYIAAGNGMLGSHSACIDEKGNLYTWGYAKATGIGSLKLINTPQQVKFPLVEQEDSNQDLITGDEDEDEIEKQRDENQTQDKKSNEKDGKKSAKKRVWINEEIVQVSCGDCFTICLTKNGHVYSWGQWSHGRLGLGPIPMIAATNKRKSKLAQFQLRPKKINSIINAVAISSGESHTLCLLSTGHVLSWGKSSLGQLGTGSYHTGLMKDHFKPYLIPTFGPPVFYNRNASYVYSPTISFTPPSFVKSSLTSNEQLYLSQFLVDEPSEEYLRILYGISTNPLEQCIKKKDALKVFCGAFHSIVIDEDKNAWTWGARGSPCLGHGDTEITGPFAKRITSYFSISTADTSIIIPKEILPWTNLWTFPRMVETLKDLEIKQVTTGDLHTGFLLESGELYICGNGPAVPYLNLNESSTNYTEDDENFKQKIVVSLPRMPSAYWLRELCGKNISYIAGFGMRMFAVFNNETSSKLTMPLFKKLTNTPDEDTDYLSNNQNIDQINDKELDELYLRGKPDCVIVTSEISMFCHRALLAHRSQVLKEKILIGSPINPLETIMVDILLPEYDRETIYSLVYYLYFDILPPFVITDASILKSIIKCGKNLKIFRLQLLAERYLMILNTSNSNEDINSVLEEFPPMTLTKDIGAMIGDIEFADVRFIAKGRTLYAHRFVLEERSEYFKKLFQSNAEEINSKFEVMDIVVPDSYQSILRMLLFIYTSTLPEADIEEEEEEEEENNEKDITEEEKGKKEEEKRKKEEEREKRRIREREGIIIEDLITAYRYDLFEMKRLCESMLHPTPSNWLDLLRVSFIVSSTSLQHQVEMFLRNYPSLLYINPTNIYYEPGTNKELEEEKLTNKLPDDSIKLKLSELSEEFPTFTTNYLVNLKIYNNSSPNIGSIEYCIENKKMPSADSLQNFPFWSLGVAGICIYIYQHVSRMVSLGWMIPVINIGAVVATVIYFYSQYMNGGKKKRRFGARS